VETSCPEKEEGFTVLSSGIPEMLTDCHIVTSKQWRGVADQYFKKFLKRGSGRDFFQKVTPRESWPLQELLGIRG
jgi:hypothetical protein